MLNLVDFNKRLKEIMDNEEESASSFSEKIGVQRSSISHILSGRNKPSLEFVLKIVETYPNIDLYWLLLGSKEYGIKEHTPQSPSQPAKTQEKDLFSEAVPASSTDNRDAQGVTFVNNSIERIVVFYKEGYFKSYSPG